MRFNGNIVCFARDAAFKESEHPRDKEGKFKPGDRVQRNPKMKGWEDTPKMREHNHGTIVSAAPGKLNNGKASRGYFMRSENQAKTLKNKNAEKWDRIWAEKGTWYAESELVPERR